MPLLSDPVARRDRAAAKRTAVLNFLGTEIWTSADILGQVIGLGARQAVHRLLVALERDDLIRRSTAPTLAGQGVTLWGITPHGRAMTPSAAPIGPVFEASKISLDRVPHHLMVQRLRLAAEAVGWSEWTRGETLGPDLRIRPDALVTRPDGRRVAVEAERTIKTPKRYQRVVAEHLRAMREGRWAGVYYVSPPPVAAGLTRLFTALEKLPGGIPWDDAGRRRFRILSQAEWPPSI